MPHPTHLSLSAFLTFWGNQRAFGPIFPALLKILTNFSAGTWLRTLRLWHMGSRHGLSHVSLCTFSSDLSSFEWTIRRPRSLSQDLQINALVVKLEEEIKKTIQMPYQFCFSTILWKLYTWRLANFPWTKKGPEALPAQALLCGHRMIALIRRSGRAGGRSYVASDYLANCLASPIWIHPVLMCYRPLDFCSRVVTWEAVTHATVKTLTSGLERWLDSPIKSTCSCRKLEFGFQHLYHMVYKLLYLQLQEA